MARVESNHNKHDTIVKMSGATPQAVANALEKLGDADKGENDNGR